MRWFLLFMSFYLFCAFLRAIIFIFTRKNRKYRLPNSLVSLLFWLFVFHTDFKVHCMTIRFALSALIFFRGTAGIGLNTIEYDFTQIKRTNGILVKQMTIVIEWHKKQYEDQKNVNNMSRLMNRQKVECNNELSKIPHEIMLKCIHLTFGFG